MPTLHSPEEKGFGQTDPALTRWAFQTYQPEDPILGEIRERCQQAGLPPIAVGRFDGLHIEILTRASGAHKAVEIGTLGGYSGVCILRGLAPSGVLHTFELMEKHAEVARESYRRAGFPERAYVHIGPALERLRDIESEGPFDLVFIDADKTNYPAYLDWAAQHLRVGGVVLGDNAFGFGGVAMTPEQVPDDSRTRIEALRRFNDMLAHGGRFRATMLPTAEGMAMGVKIR